MRSRIRISADLGSFAAPRSFSQLVTSFFGAMYHRHPPYALCSLIFLSRLLILTYKKNPKISTRQKWSSLGLPALPCSIRSRINHLLRSTFLSIAFRTLLRLYFFLHYAVVNLLSLGICSRQRSYTEE